MKKTIIVTIFILSFSFVLISCNNPKDKEKITTLSGGYEGILERIDSTYKKDANFDICVSKSINGCLNSIVNEKAQAKNDYKICDDLSEESIVDACKIAVILNKAKKEENYKLCDNLSLNKEVCYYQVLSFLATEKLDQKYCDTLDDVIKESTGTGLSTIVYDKKMCIDSVIMQTAIKNKDESYCKKLNNKSMQTVCKTNVNPSNGMLLPPLPPVPPVNNAQIIK